MGTVFVSKAGNNDNAGTDSGSPKSTIQAAVEAVDHTSAPRIVTILDSGTYNELIEINPAGNGFGADITIQGDTGQLPILSGNGLSDIGGVNNGPISIGPVVPSVTILKNIKFTEFAATQGVLRGDKGIGGGAAYQVSDCEFDQNDKVAQDLGGTSDKHTTFNRCKFTRNDIFINNGSNIHIDITNCVFGGVEDETCIDPGGGSNSSNTTVQNCSLVVNMDDASIAIRAGVVENCAVQNLTATSTGGSNTTKGISALTSRSNNLTFGNFNTQQEGGDDTGAITGQDPLFVDTTITAPDLSVPSNSPLIGAGKTIAAITTDFIGTSRAVPYDIGAFQFVYWMGADNPEGDETKFGPNGFEIRSTKRKLASRVFPAGKDNRQAPFSITIQGPVNIRGRTTSYKAET